VVSKDTLIDEIVVPTSLWLVVFELVDDVVAVDVGLELIVVVKLAHKSEMTSSLCCTCDSAQESAKQLCAKDSKLEQVQLPI
jgi:hypothetical protein